ncbi:MAG TPA: galactokinase, partial [Streptosporangiaceae bacterium]|nr:galactokinase [Streptosporangiaceae bacterium]
VLTSCQEGTATVEVPLAGLVPGTVVGWAAYPAGVAWSLRGAGYPIGGLNVAIDADLALGAGLSSSAALECAVALAMLDLHGLVLPRTELAKLARRAENDFVGAPTGIMDQIAVLLSQEGHALLLDCRTATVAQVPFDPAAAGLVLMIINTRARHELTDGGYASRRRACEEAARTLGVRALRDITSVSQLDQLTDPLLLRRARHIVTDDARVLQAVALLRANDLISIGPLLTTSHISLRDDFEVSWPEADVAVDAAIEAGALGARMVGGGFGGSVIALLPTGQTDPVTDAVNRRFALNGWSAPTFTTAVPSASAARLR